ncbi:hypothetical protein GA0074695_4514 [Micromonospora viridifaciens]|uniref:PH domain-containing protein n=1 Tax=Micromonospora viridifaciens TaxID=1881 RepID=A0A1C4YP15_MICVI|nr:hypothetical protein [Micromonospora viridifaciens]SCF22475.1 hypothetical protein GA0074695_4514 [Micromonospora viridifaciens]
MDLQKGTAFRPSSPLIFGFYLLIAVVAWVFVQAVLAVVWGPPYDLPGAALSGVIFVAVYTAVSFALHRRNWSSVDVAGETLRLAAKGRTAVLPWQVIHSAMVRYPGPFATLRVTLRPEAILPPTTLRPRMRAGRAVYQVNVGLLRPTPRVLRAELARHLPPTPARA